MESTIRWEGRNEKKKKKEQNLLENYDWIGLNKIFYNISSAAWRRHDKNVDKDMYKNLLHC